MIIYEDTFISGNPVRINRIQSLIVEEVHKYISRTGYDPDSVYLGEDQYKALSEYLREHGYYFIKEPTSVQEQFLGMNVYKVIAKDHLAVSGIK